MNSESRLNKASHDLESGRWTDLSAHSGRIAAVDLGCARADRNSARIEKTLRL
jgi:hypothetical protein